MAIKRMDNVGIVVDDLAATIDFFLELGLERLRKHGARNSWARSCNTKTRTGSATSAGLKGFSSDSPRNSVRALVPAIAVVHP
jgi:catechol 2,3-dioxygenase-like lactoylglutathione lyase family enzyme